MLWLIPVAALAYLALREDKKGSASNPYDLNPGLDKLPKDIQVQLSQLIATGTKQQLLTAADFWQSKGFPEAAAVLRQAASQK